MAPSARAQGREPAAITIGSLGDDLLAKCLSSFGQADLLSRAAIVCRRWRSVSTRPELLREVVFDVAEGATLPAAQSLLRWLQRHGQAVRSLVLDLGIRGRLSAVEEMEFVCLLDGCVNVCASSLERLTLNLYTDSYTIGAWVATAHRLKELNLDTQGMTAWVTLAGLISMRRLHLDALRWQLGTAVALPPSLTCLMISNHKADEMPTQVAALSNLHSLRLFGGNYSAAGMASLTRLTSLQHAEFSSCQLPGSLSELTGLLQVLDISHPYGEAAAVAASLHAALQQLTQLTGLRLYGLPAAAVAPPSLAALSRLQWLYLEEWDEPQEQPARPELPLGPWQRSLRHLATTFAVAQRSLPFLTGAQRLQRISFLEPPEPQPEAEEQWHAFWRWAAQHAPLQCVGFGESEVVQSALMEATLELKERRPELLLDTRVSRFSVCDDMLSCWDL